ncbi:MAG TPA: hypothetical protein VIM31_01305 [Candidatus Microsaccharimonas sp.]|jgi:hypothetical protein
MRVIETSESEKAQRNLDNQLEQLDLYATGEFVAALRDAHLFGYQYIDIAVLERSLVAIAALQGITNIRTAEEAVFYLAQKGTDDAEKIDSLETSNSELAEKLEKAEEQIIELGKRPAADPDEQFIVTKDQIDNTSGILLEVNEVLVRVPGQRTLAQQAIRAARRLDELETTTVVIVQDDETW